MRLPATPGPWLPLGGLLLATVLGVASARLAGVTPLQPDEAPTVAERSLRFIDHDDGAVEIADARDGRRLATIAPGTQGFLRSAVRGLARERHRRGLGPEQPFVLRSRADGRLTLLDDATGRRIDLEAFGPTNAAVFARLLAPAPTER